MWRARLQLDYAHDATAPRTTARFRHEGPLRVLRSLYPEGSGICHNVLVHPPGGLVGGDELAIDIAVASGAHGLVTTPGATRFYRSEGDLAAQRTSIRLERDARLEWLPLETLYYDGCLAESRLVFELGPGAQMIGWDVASLGLPHAGRDFRSGTVHQHIELRGVWLDAGRIDAGDRLLLDGKLGLDGQRCLGSLFLASGGALEARGIARALDLARACLATAPDCRGGATCIDGRIIVVRVLSPLVEPAMQLLDGIRQAWRKDIWNLAPIRPRIWNV